MSPYVWVIPWVGTADMVGGEVGKVRPIWWRAIGSAVISIGVFLAACSHDPVQPAPVQLMGAGSVPDAPVPTMGGPQPVVSSAGIRRIVAAPAPTPSAAPPRHDLKRASVAGDHPTSTRKNARGRLAIRHVAAPSRHAKPYSGTRQSTAQGTGAEAIPLDNPAGSTRAQPWAAPGRASASGIAIARAVGILYPEHPQASIRGHWRVETAAISPREFHSLAGIASVRSRP